MFMKNTFNLIVGIALLATIASCTKYKALDFEVDMPESVALQEDLNSYPALKSYINRTAHPNFKWGAALSLPEYINKTVKYRLVNRNFDEIVMGYEMKHGAVVQADGSLALDNVKKLLYVAKEAGTTIYGHTLAWHANQNANYLKGLITPLLVTAPGFNNDLNLAGLKDGTFNGWTRANSGAETSLVNSGMGAGTRAIKLVSTGSSSAAIDLKLISPSINIIPGKKYEILCYIKSDKAGEGRISFEGLTNNTPTVDWMKTGKATATFTTGISWKEVRFQVNDFTGTSIKLHFDLGYKPNTTYYIDVNNLYVYDIAGPAMISNLVAGGDFETGSGWGGWGPNSTRGVTANGLGYGNTGKAFFVTNTVRATNFWDIQTSYPFASPLNLNETYELSFWVKGTANGIIRPELQSANYSSNGFGQVNVTTDWRLVTAATTATAADRSRLIFSYGEYAGTVYIDNVVLKVQKQQEEQLLRKKLPWKRKLLLGMHLKTGLMVW
jgi:endo-1,4-beta-xylanase